MSQIDSISFPYTESTYDHKQRLNALLRKKFDTNDRRKIKEKEDSAFDVKMNIVETKEPGKQEDI
jgi:hypothetical protein